MSHKRVFVPLILIFGALSISSESMGTESNGLELLTNCKLAIEITEKSDEYFDNTDLIKGINCVSYVQGFVESHYYNAYMRALLNNPEHNRNERLPEEKINQFKFFCAPINVSYPQYYRVIIKHLEDHPEVLNLSRYILIADALITAFPCNN